MARTSKRYATKQEEPKITMYRAGIYTRLSSERNESFREKSSSIETQILCCKEYALKENIDITDIYTDYEWSGTNFERPRFQDMMQDIKNRKINCIIIRDLSRLGREYIEMGRLIEKVFPFLGVRFVSVDDKIDTIKDDNLNKSFEITIKNIINDMYAKDISIKIKSSKQSRAKNGYFIGSVPPYGYKIEKLKEGQKLVIDENVKFIVEEMFDLTLQGKSQYEVAKIFNKKGYSTSMVYYKTGRVYRNEVDPQWHKCSIARMLINPVYTGTLVQGVKQQDLANGIKQHFVDKSKHIIVEDAHEPIISKEIYEEVLKIRATRKENCKFNAPMHNFERDYENRYKGLVINNNTGKELLRRTRIYGKNKDRFYYFFQNDRYTGSLKQEKSVFVMERDLDKAIEEKVAECIVKSTSEEKLIKRICSRFDSTLSKLDKSIYKLNNKICKEENSIQKLYEDYSLGKINREKYKVKREIVLSKITQINNEIIHYETNKSEIKEEKINTIKVIENLYLVNKLGKLSSELINSLVEKIIVYDKHNFEIVFKFNIDNIIGGVEVE